ncbi:MAG: glycosyl hydrolase family protein [Capsulimonadaceae bacterium]
MITRRQLLIGAAAAAAAASLPRWANGQGAGQANLSLTVNPEGRPRRIPESYTGLSYESEQLGTDSFFAPSNTGLLAFFKGVGDFGVLRIGGNTSEFTTWSPDAAAGTVTGAVSPDTGSHPIKHTTITRSAIDHLAGFLEASGWSLIYGLNLGHGTPDAAADEAAYVAKAVGSGLLYFQNGNEPNLYHQNGIRPLDYSFGDFRREWDQFHDAVLAKTPGATYGGPDVAGAVDWVEQFSYVEGSRIVELTGHYYAEGPPSNPSMNIDRLLRPHRRLVEEMQRQVAAGVAAGVPFRMAEGNSCYNGGKPGVSDTFASTLWGADYMLLGASIGYSGINFHGGGHGHYTPIAGSAQDGFSARPLYYGMLLVRHMLGGELLETTLDDQGLNVTAYAVRHDRELRIALFNKEQQQPATVSIAPGRRHGSATLWRLSAPAVDSTTGVTLAGAAVAADASWAPAVVETLHSDHDGTIRVDLPAASGALVFVS